MTTRKDVWTINPDAPEVAQACSLALGVLSTCSVNSWREFCDGLDKIDSAVYRKFASIPLLSWQEELLDEYQPEFQFLSVSPLQTLAVCATCEEWIVINSEVPPRCLITIGCTGVPIKVTAAKKVESNSLGVVTT
jgi:hypothetical protein